MLEALIAFFAVTEEHDAIGAIDYSPEIRKKLAIQSRKWKCEACGPIVNLVPEKKKKEPNVEKVVEVIHFNQNTTNIQPLNCAENLEKDGDNISENKVDGSPGSQVNVKKTSSKSKKSEHDKKSNIIGGVIVEDINEEDFDDELGKSLNIHRNQTDINFDKNTAKSHMKKLENLHSNQLAHANSIGIDPTKQNSTSALEDTDTLKRHKSDNIHSHSDFSEYLKKLRQMQFEGESNELSELKGKNHTNIPEKQLNNSTNINNKKPSNIPDSNFVGTNSKENINNIKTPDKNPLRDQLEEETEFYNIAKTVKFHKAKNKEEILNDLFQERLIDFIKDPMNMPVGTGPGKSKSVETNTIQANINKQNKNIESKIPSGNLSNTDYMMYLNQKDKLEGLLKQKVNVMKYLSKRAYKQAKSRRILGLNITMGLFIVVIFLLYFYFRNHV
jgi:hypothetical protein